MFLVRIFPIFFLSLVVTLSSCKKDEPDPIDETEDVLAAFSGDPTTIIFGESVQFTDESTGNPTSWSWSFDGGTPSTSDEQNPVVIYDEPGVFNVTLVAGNEGSDNQALKSSYINVEAPS
ncbi:MAG: PKD domain-containing protein, partial [Flavobacteriales bacterium]|nr:PKD domain-containing protein [Flavobacteriales bacterium]